MTLTCLCTPDLPLDRTCSSGASSTRTHQGGRREGPSPTGPCLVGGNAMEASQYSTRLKVEGGRPRVHSSEFFAQRSKRSPGS